MAEISLLDQIDAVCNAVREDLHPGAEARGEYHYIDVTVYPTFVVYKDGDNNAATVQYLKRDYVIGADGMVVLSSETAAVEQAWIEANPDKTQPDVMAMVRGRLGIR